MADLVWVVDFLDDVRSDMSRFHRVDEVEHLEAGRFFAFASRLNAYGGVLAHMAKQQQTEQSSPDLPAVSSQQDTLKDIREHMATDPLYQGLITAVQVPATE